MLMEDFFRFDFLTLLGRATCFFQISYSTYPPHLALTRLSRNKGSTIGILECRITIRIFLDLTDYLII